MIHSFKELKAIDFFCGGGGMTHGLRRAGINVVAGVDFDIDAKETFEINNKGTTFVFSDVDSLSVSYFEEQFNIQRNDDNLILVGCSPCQYYSIINTDKERSKKSKDLLKSFFRFIDFYNPGYVVVENVPGIKSNKNSILPEFLELLRNKGYFINERIVDLSFYKVPQSRKRFSLIASRLHENIELPIPSNKQVVLKDVIGIHNGFKSIPPGHIDKTNFIHTSAGLKEINIKRLEKTQKNGGNRLDWKDDKELQLNCYIGKDSSFVDTFGRMHWEKPASTITTKFFSISNGRFAHPDEDRAISLREGATLQTFPKSYTFKTSSIAATAKLIGNAVPPAYAEQLGQCIIKQHKGS